MKSQIMKVAGLGSVASLAVMGGVAVDLDVVEALSGDEVINTDVASEALTCGDSLSQNENSIVAAEYAKVAEADCMFVGCGGVF